uniref:GDSL esterase/lipase At2g30220-like n=1 Tax=Nicotiana tabacum TaxID=4097 RepID=A0A1S4B5S1_TOBAC|nr:PREDICTED: GDSL esterase/lipase At2g30220-like [Nicotiana tabacum]
MGITSFFFILLVQLCNGKSLPKFSAILIFGDSTVDTGNNNYISTIFQGNHRPYGENFPGRIPTGRFSDGKLVPDFLASMLGLKEYVPPFLQPYLSKHDLLTGVSFASAGSGYDDLTTAASKAIPMSQQIKYFEHYIEKLQGIVGEEKAQKILSGALVIISAGTNDFIFNFYDIPTRRNQFNITGYQDFLLIQLQNFVEDLYNLGCRKMLVAGLPPVGCLPIQITAKSPFLRKCIEEENFDVQSYNAKLTRLLKQVQAALSGSKVLYSDTYHPFMQMIKHPKKYGFVKTRQGCCGSGTYEAGPFCNKQRPVCKNASKYLFWDSIHPGESAYRYLSNMAMKKLLRHKLSHNKTH